MRAYPTLSRQRVVFFGSPTFAIPSLEALTAIAVPLVVVVTQPDKPAGRGHRVVSPPVSVWAKQHGIPVFQPKGLKRPENRAFLDPLKPDLLVVVAYGKILPAELLDLPTRGAVNVHASLLPRYRGPAPIAASLLAGDTETGVTIMVLDEGMDTGPILAQERIPIAADDTTETLGRKLSALGAQLLVPTLERWLSGNLSPAPQDDRRATICRMLSKEDGRIDWTKPAVEIERMIRAYTPWPGAWTEWKIPDDRRQPRRLRIHRASALSSILDHAAAVPGTVVRQRDGRILVLAGSGSALLLHTIQLQDRSLVEAEAFTRGSPAFLGSPLI